MFSTLCYRFFTSLGNLSNARCLYPHTALSGSEQPLHHDFAGRIVFP
jgi:hypothetical protein